MTDLHERRMHRMIGVGVGEPTDGASWEIVTTNTNGSLRAIQSKEIDDYMSRTSPPISRQDFLSRAEGWVRTEDMQKLYLADFRESLGILVSILLHRDIETPEEVLNEKGIL